MICEGQAKRYCCEDISKIENYDKAIADTTQTWVCHHRTEIWWNCTEKELKANGCYYGRKALELIFMPVSEHRRLHTRGERNINYGKHRSDETKRKMSTALKGKMAGEKNPMYGKKWKLIDGKRVYFSKEAV